VADDKEEEGEEEELEEAGKEDVPVLAEEVEK
jgi:hypothetical protein